MSCVALTRRAMNSVVVLVAIHEVVGAIFIQPPLISGIDELHQDEGVMRVNRDDHIGTSPVVDVEVLTEDIFGHWSQLPN